MSRANYMRTIYFLNTQHNEEKPLVLSELEHCLSQTIPCISPEQLLNSYRQDIHKIVLIDFYERHTVMPQLKALDLSSQRIETIIFNVERRLKTDELLTFGNLKGLFYDNETLESITLGLSEIINGQNWLPRHAASQLIHHYRNLFHDFKVKASIALTAREIQILRCLQTGASNMQMADNLFISEFTVKSHLYQIFKKISVKNRVQAIAWANQNLVS
jgi:LuxR family transcriptional regulator, csgAB operon transcriptional regulatory protein